MILGARKTYFKRKVLICCLYPEMLKESNLIPLQILTLSVQLDPVDFLFYPLAEKNVEYGAFTKRFLA